MRCQRLILTALFALFASAAQAATTVENIRIWAESGKTRVVLDLSTPADHSIFTLRGPDRLVVDLKDGRLASTLTNLPSGVGSVRTIRSGVRANGQLRVVLDLNENVRSRSFTAGPNSQYGDRLVIDLQRSGNLQTVKRASEAYTPGRDIVIAIDPGHGGHDPGAIGKARTKEKDVALAVSRNLAARINAERGMRAILIRNGDYYVDHRRRTDIARKNDADLFVSIHADAVDDRRANGATVYALSTKGASDEEARLLAERENAAVRVGGVSLEDKDEVLAEVLLDLSQNAALSASLDVGSKVIAELSRIVKVRRRTVQQAGLLVLKSPDMPSILVETAYISNPAEEKKLRNSAHQARLANAVLAGIRNYFYTNPPPDTQIAMDVRKTPERRVRHVIARGDTLSEIAARYNVSAAAIRAANRLNNDNIRVGQTLSIPIFPGS
ncbi:MAG: N-acetylmuramoyl-L-alanine amidase [Gammaproteobacteria bacterium]|nr:N-acetylmuramoyl-L-alanine amidase [Gammaproteobacteria bacterium]MDH3750635.1 N-acetylmuramoyl-L-alanine amidase [Gammaproteobacteria bacterium]MDH3804348.1 N-acetylmuramoyl-L-alanine amidase [Gammaproteobacteria bacterium]